MANKNIKNKSITYRPLTTFDIEDAVRLHRALIPSAGARMGAPYLRELYTMLLKYPVTHAVLGAYTNDQLIGLISTTINVRTTEKILNKRLFSIIPTVIFGFIQHRYSLNELLSHMQVHSKIRQLSDVSTMYILGIAVDPKVQRRGIATHLIEKSKTRWGAKNILVDTQTRNFTAQNFYKKIGLIPHVFVADSIIFQNVAA